MAVSRDQVLALLLDACPSFQSRWEEWLASGLHDSERTSVALGCFARHLVALLMRQEKAELPAVFDAVERLYVEGDASVREAATIGLLEALQNASLNQAVSPDGFVPFLREETAAWWQELNRFWDGEVPYVGAGLDPSRR